MGKIITAVVAVYVLTAIAIYTVSCPCERMPGLWLTGYEVDQPQADWGFINDVGLCELEVSSWRPHSITLNCMSADGELFISCSQCEGKYWSGVALDNPAATLRAEGRLYPVMLTRLTAADHLDKAWLARITKLKRPLDSPRPDHWWSFKLNSRSP